MKETDDYKISNSSPQAINSDLHKQYMRDFIGMHLKTVA